MNIPGAVSSVLKGIGNFGREVFAVLSAEAVRDGLKWADTNITRDQRNVLAWYLTGRIPPRVDDIWETAVAEMVQSSFGDEQSAALLLQARVARLEDDSQNYYRLATVPCFDEIKDDEDFRKAVDETRKRIRGHALMTEIQWQNHVNIMNFNSRKIRGLKDSLIGDMGHVKAEARSFLDQIRADLVGRGGRPEGGA